MRTSIPLKLRISEAVAYRVYDEFEEADVSQEKEGYCIVETSLQEGEWLYSYLLSYGAALEVLEPSDVREELMKRIQSMLGVCRKNQ
ncbi:WYL domain-containing protein [Pullulanibacillus camelliae]|uniref:WYL domain-containing protein n=1 Tax=Pullulanibacillus camelliae TaxID=1707096 RepID=UPI00166AE596